MTLRYPPHFVAGAYRSDLPPDLARTLRERGGRLPFENALVLVEPGRLGTRDRTALPAGEVTAITIEPQSGVEAAARRDLGRQIYGAVLELTGHRKFLETPAGDTSYDRVIEQIIGTLILVPSRP
jgi:hypothetical protein